MSIMIETISANRYAPKGGESVDMFSTGFEGGSGLTLGQLSIAVSLRAAAVCESQSVTKMNMMASGSANLEKASQHMENIANDNVTNWNAVKTFLTTELGISADDLPAAVDTYSKRLQAIDAIKVKIDQLTQTQQTSMIDLQTLVNRRDTAYSTSSNMVRALGTSMSKGAANLL